MGHRLDAAGALVAAAEPKPRALEWYITDHKGLEDKPDVVIADKTWKAKAGHTYLITGVLGGIGMVFKTNQPRVYYAKVNGTLVWGTHLGAIRDGSPASSMVETAVPILATYAQAADGDAHLTVGMTRRADQDWELGNGVHNVSVVDLGCLA